MKFRYDKEDDVLMIWFSSARVDYAEQTGNIIVHFSKNNKPVLMEILDATSFLLKTSKSIPRDMRQRVFA